MSELKHKVDVNTLEHLAGKTLALNEVGYVNFALSQPLAFDPYRDNRDMGGFIVIDRFTNATVGAGMIDFSLMRATNVHWQALDVLTGSSDGWQTKSVTLPSNAQYIQFRYRTDEKINGRGWYVDGFQVQASGKTSQPQITNNQWQQRDY